MLHVHHLDPDVQISVHHTERGPDILIAFINFELVLCEIFMFLYYFLFILCNFDLALIPHSHGLMEILQAEVHVHQYLVCVHIVLLFELVEQWQNQSLDLLTIGGVCVDL